MRLPDLPQAITHAVRRQLGCANASTQPHSQPTRVLGRPKVSQPSKVGDDDIERRGLFPCLMREKHFLRQLHMSSASIVHAKAFRVPCCYSLLSFMSPSTAFTGTSHVLKLVTLRLAPVGFWGSDWLPSLRPDRQASSIRKLPRFSTQNLSTDTNMVQIVPMRNEIRVEQPGPVTTLVVRPRADHDIVHSVVRSRRCPRRQPILHVGVVEAQRVGWQPRHGVLDVRDAVLVAGLRRDEGGKLLVADSR